VSDQVPFHLPPVDPAAAADVPADVLSPELLASLLVDGDDELAAWTLRNAMAESSRAAVYDGILRDAMRLVGENWRNGRWSVAEEHLASRTLLAVMEQLRPRTGPESRIGPMAVLAGVAGEQHMIGLVCLEQVLAEDGWTVANLGADLPDTDLAGFIARNDVSLVALTASEEPRLNAMAEAVVAVRVAAGARPVAILVGGRIAYEPGIKDRIGVDGVALDLTEARAFAARHRPADR
jgi:methanogenic corrinoid protein MtbC1